MINRRKKITTKALGEEGERKFIGVVVDVRDPHQLGRVKVRIFGIHDDVNEISDEDLPWAPVIMSPLSASLSGKGLSPTGLLPDSYVLGYFMDGQEAQMPFITGTYHKMPDLDPNKSDVNVLARGTNSIKKELVGPEPESPYKAQYPKNTVYESKSGHIIEIDDTDGDERIHIYHRKGTYIEVDKNGRIVIKSMDSSIDVSNKTKQIFAKEDITIQSEKNINISAKENISIVAKNIELKSGSSSVTISDGIIKTDSDNVKFASDYLSVDSPISSISGVTLTNSNISASKILSSKVISSQVTDKITAGLSSSIGSLNQMVKDLSSLTSISNIGDLTTALENAFGSLSTQLDQVSSNIIDATVIKTDGILGQVDSTINNISGVASTLDTQIDNVMKNIQINTPSIAISNSGIVLNSNSSLLSDAQGILS